MSRTSNSCIPIILITLRPVLIFPRLWPIRRPLFSGTSVILVTSMPGLYKILVLLFHMLGTTYKFCFIIKYLHPPSTELSSKNLKTLTQMMTLPCASSGMRKSLISTLCTWWVVSRLSLLWSMMPFRSSTKYVCVLSLSHLSFPFLSSHVYQYCKMVKNLRHEI